MTELFLQKVVENNIQELPENFNVSDIEIFGREWKLFDFQKQALENTIKLLYLYFNEPDNGKENLYHYYTAEGLSKDFEMKNLWVTGKDSNFKLLAKYFTLVNNNNIQFKEFINRASFWMATGSGKTLVMVKLIEILHKLMLSNAIPKKPILFLAPKDEILKQLKFHIDIYNSRGEFFIDFKNLKEWEKNKDFYSLNNIISVYFYRADNITEENKDKQIDYNTYYNNGDWYVILDEAHKGEKATSKRQQYFTILSKNGFLFNFSATFTDVIDFVTTVFDFKLDRFLQNGYGKKIYIAHSEFKNFKSVKKSKEIINDFNQDERKNIILQTLILYAVAKKHSKNIKKVNPDLYHSPLLVTVANSVNTDEADLKIFYELLAEIALRKIDFNTVKKSLTDNMKNHREYAINELGELSEALIKDIENIKENEFYENVFNTGKSGEIEVIKFQNNTRELAFRIKGASKYFGLAHASEIIQWQENVLDGYETVESVESGIFKDINQRDDINILLGSRIFGEGWDSNRPNIINFINMAVDEKSKKLFLQTIGRGLRIEPIKGFRKRFEKLENKTEHLTGDEISLIYRNNEFLETLFVFATSKEVVKKIIDDLEKQSEKWIKINGIKKNPNIDEKRLPIYIPDYKYKIKNDAPYKIHKNDKKRLIDYVRTIGDKLLILRDNVKIRTLKKISEEKSFIEGAEKKFNTENLIKNIDSYWNKETKKIIGFKILEDEITHYNYIQTNLINEIKQLEAEIKTILSPNKYTEDEIDRLFDTGKIDKEKYKKLIKEFQGKVALSDRFQYKIFNEHYYIPLLHNQNLKHFKHIIKVGSEIEFLDKLVKYSEKEDNKLNQYDWWYFSKLDESIDKISIPYFDTKIGEYRNFCPDFIFWLKKSGKYYIKFVDPKGIEHTQNPADKAKGFEQIQNDIKFIKDRKIEKIDLFFFNKDIPDTEYKKYWVFDIESIF